MKPHRIQNMHMHVLIYISHTHKNADLEECTLLGDSEHGRATFWIIAPRKAKGNMTTKICWLVGFWQLLSKTAPSPSSMNRASLLGDSFGIQMISVVSA